MKTIYGNCDNRLISTMPDGSVAVTLFPGDGSDLQDRLDRLKEVHPEYFENCRLTTVNNIPKDRIFRGAWTDANPTDTVDIDLDKAKEIHLARVREVRNSELTKTDPEFIKALSKGDSTKEIEATKQALRDIPQNLDVSKIETVEDLIASWPKELPLHNTYKKKSEND